jgi:hypothetical protein
MPGEYIHQVTVVFVAAIKSDRFAHQATADQQGNARFSHS